MGTSAQINQVAALISSHALSILNLSVDGRYLERISLEELQGFCLGEDETLELLVLVCNFLGGFLNDGVILVREYLRKRRKKRMRQLAALETKRYLKTITYIFASVRVVEETIIRWGSMGQMHAELEFKTLTENVST